MENAKDQLLAQAIQWSQDDPDPVTRAELTDLIDRAQESGRAATEALAELGDRFQGPLTFGTAGLRGAMGAGQHRMNRAVVIRAAAGIGAYLNETLAAAITTVAAPSVVIGYDARHNSATFARDSAAVLQAAGCHVTLLPAAWPTPVLAFAVRSLSADVGIMVTASHNPPADNGYKVYLGGRVESGSGQGAQLVPPADQLIAQHIAAAPAAVSVPMASDGWSVAASDLLDQYLATVAAMVPSRERRITVVGTPLHGVGGVALMRAATAAGFTQFSLVAEQAEPDPNFPTVDFPNPEEPGAMDLAIATASRIGAHLVVACDPDADRCSVAIPRTTPELSSDDGSDAAPVQASESAGVDPGGYQLAGGTAPGSQWRQLTGDEVGMILGYLATQNWSPGKRFANSIVSSQQLAAWCRLKGIEHHETLTGFKWISRVPDLHFGYEEALGYCLDPAQVRDKDGVSAVLTMMSLADDLAQEGRTLADLLDEIAVVTGVFSTGAKSWRFENLDDRTNVMSWLLTHAPTDILGAGCRVDDLSVPSGNLPATEGVRYQADTCRVLIRPSGTEPKLKAYLEVRRMPVPNSNSVVLNQEKFLAGSQLQELISWVDGRVTRALASLS